LVLRETSLLIRPFVGLSRESGRRPDAPGGWGNDQAAPSGKTSVFRGLLQQEAYHITGQASANDFLVVLNSLKLESILSEVLSMGIGLDLQERGEG